MAADADPTPRPASLGDIPLVVIRHGRSVLPIQGAITPEVSEEYEATWAQMQAELARLSPQGRVVVAEGSGHGVQLDRPDVVIGAIRDVLAAARLGRRALAISRSLFSSRHHPRESPLQGDGDPPGAG